MGVMELAKKIAGSRAAGGGNHFRDGRGRLIVKSLKLEELYKGDTFIAELLVESSEGYADAKDEKGNPVPPNAPGSTVSFIQQFEEFPDTAFGNTKSFILELMGESDESLAAAAAAKGNGRTADDEFAEALAQLVSKAQPARGMALDYETYRRTAKKSGKTLILPKWGHVKQTVEEIAARRARLDGAEPAAK